MGHAEQFEALKKFPDRIRDAFFDFIEDDELVDIIKKQLKNTGVVIEYGNYQISISSIEELEELKNCVEEYCEEV